MIYLGHALWVLGSFVLLAAVIWQIVEAFRDGAGWGVFSILGLCLFCIPNMIWCLAKWDKGWRVIVAVLGAFPPIFIGVSIVLMEHAVIYLNQ